MDEIITKAPQENGAADDQKRLKNMPSHFVYVEAPDDAGRLMRVGAMFQHASGQGWALRLDKGENARQLVYEHGDDLVVLQNRRRMELESQLGNVDLKAQAHNNFEEAVHPNRVAPASGGPGGPG